MTILNKFTESRNERVTRGHAGREWLARGVSKARTPHECVDAVSSWTDVVSNGHLRQSLKAQELTHPYSSQGP